MFKIGKSFKKLIFGPVKHEKFSRGLTNDFQWSHAFSGCYIYTIFIVTFVFLMGIAPLLMHWSY